jgi:hypothetical protein
VSPPSPDGGPASEPDLWLSDRPVTVTVSGHSMEPVLSEGDRVEVVRAEPRRLRPGQMVVFRRGAEVVIHRLLLVRDDRFLEKGDAQERGNWWPWPEALGVAVARRRGDSLEDLLAGESSPGPVRRARHHLRIHRIHAAAARIPWALPRRILLRLARPLL